MAVGTLLTAVRSMPEQVLSKPIARDVLKALLDKYCLGAEQRALPSAMGSPSASAAAPSPALASAAAPSPPAPNAASPSPSAPDFAQLPPSSSLLGPFAASSSSLPS